MPSDRRNSCSRTFKRIIPAATAWSILLVSTGLFFAYPCIFLMKTYHFSIPIFEGIVTFFVFYNFTMATFMDAGIIPKSLPDERRKLNEVQPMFFDLEIRSVSVSLKWCVTCQFYRPPRCTHCGICDSCIERFDHHCPWVNNCIGRRNYRYFFMFLIWLSIHMILIFILCVLCLCHHLNSLKDTITIITLLIMVIIIVVFIPILGLTMYHIMLIVRGRTTNEQVTGKFFENRNPYSYGCARNVFNGLCSGPYPSFKKYFDLKTALPEENNRQGPYAIPTNQLAIYQTQDRLSLDTSLPHASHSRDCEPSPPPYKANRSNMFLSLNHSSSQNIRNHRAITPPVMSDGRRRHFDSSRRSLPPQHRFHSSSQVNDYTLSDPGNLKNLHLSVSNHFPSQPSNMPLSLYNSIAALRQHENNGMKHSIHSISNSIGEMSPFPRFIDPAIDRSETCCLGNQTVEKLQELAHKNAEAFNKCGSTYEGPLHDTAHLTATHLLPMIGNTCVDCQRTSASPSIASTDQTQMDLSRLPGRRPLSFVKAMEMSDTLEHICSTDTSYLQNSLPYFYQQKLASQEDDPGQEVSYEIRV